MAGRVDTLKQKVELRLLCGDGAMPLLRLGQALARSGADPCECADAFRLPSKRHLESIICGEGIVDLAAMCFAAAPSAKPFVRQAIAAILQPCQIGFGTLLLRAGILNAALRLCEFAGRAREARIT